METVWIPGGNSGGYQKMYSALAAGGGPDIAQVELRSIPEFMLVNGLVDLTRYGAKDLAATSTTRPLWAQVSFVDGVYGIPQDSGPMAFYYQPALFEKVGGDPPKTWDEWAATGPRSGKAKELHRLLRRQRRQPSPRTRSRRAPTGSGPTRTAGSST